MRAQIKTHFEWQVFQKAFDAAMQIFELSKTLPREETYSLTDQIRRSSRSVCANLSEAWRKRRYHNAFVAKLSDAESEAAETQTWIAFAVKAGYVPRDPAAALHLVYDEILRMIVAMIHNPQVWLIPQLR